ncbi:hypothetical protein K493DRAFT_335694 [Basidiobolus meristosporus CBS 931.73]|uniref:Origin recognition complex subunit 6 n=1 Tax=Basidiobolus meristosporus CBS 931.73 TaxID=1314790 RepID=A0A1Y1YNM2_9FUNG|nr:hypothetical protein K493DRAFT_335694 [Basidiobolus meristosporus CBS 931.73]|eukprot:ORX99578.1 hypothetical protein K493DRAFT_335694 [Basidiobolus meristosporus CBS 931.73]
MSSIDHLISSLQLEQNLKIAEKAREFLELVNFKIPSTSLKQGGVCKPALCVQLACESLHEDFSQPALVSLSGVPPNVYRNTMAIVKRSLSLNTQVTVDELGVQFGCTQITPSVAQLMQSFRGKWTSMLTGAQLNSVDFEHPVYLATAFYKCCKSLGVKIDKASVVTVCGCQNNQFNAVLKALEQICKEEIKVLEESKKSAKTPRRKKKTQEETNPDDPAPQEQGEAPSQPPKEAMQKSPVKETKAPVPTELIHKQGPVSGVAAMISGVDYRHTRKYREYLSWKQSILNEIQGS